MAEGDNVFTGPLSNPTLRTIFVWGVAVNLLGRMLDPFLTQLEQAANAEHPEHVLDPATLADMVMRHRIEADTATTEAAGSGINAERFARMVSSVGEPPGLDAVLELWRRGFLDDWPAGPDAAIAEAVHTSRIMDEWLPFVRKLRYTVPSPSDVIDAAVESQVDEATARELFAKGGIDPEFYDLLFHTRGRPPGPGELADAANRGFIPWEGTGPDATTFQQGIAESAVKNKWTPTLRDLAQYHPPPRTVTALLREGAIDEAHALTLFQQSGLTPELAAAYVGAATHQKVQSDKDLAKSEVMRLYEYQAIDNHQAVELLDPLGYRGQAAEFLLSLADMRREARFLETAIGRIHTLYVARKITVEAATAALDQLAVPHGQRDQLIELWRLERTASVRILTEAQIVDAWEFKVVDQSTAMAELEAIGYTPFDAWVLLSVKNKSPLPNPPARGPSPSGNIT